MPNEDETKLIVDENANLIDDAEEATIGMSEINSFHFERAALLMHVIEKVASVAPKSTQILGLAQAALNEMNEEAKVIAKRRADEFAKVEAAARQRAEDERREREEATAEEAEAAQPTAPRAIPARAPAPNPDVRRL
jgi:hypothetical protein